MSADPIDNASDIEETLRAAAIMSTRANVKPIEAATHCLDSNCGLPLTQVEGEPPRRWCDAFCRDAWQREQYK